APLPPEQVDPVPGTPLELARATAAGEVVTSRLDCAGGTCQVALSRLSGRDGSVLWTQGFAAPVDRPYLLAEAVEGYLRRGYPDHRVRHGASTLQVRPEDYAEYLGLRQAFEKEQQEELPAAALESLAGIRRRSPRFLEAFVFEAEVLQHRFQVRRDPEDLERATRLLAAARELAPADPRPLFTQFEVDLRRQRLDRAEEVLRDLDRLQPGDPGILVLRARLLEARGRGEEALAAIREAVRRSPSWRHLHWQARLEQRHGDTAAARRSLEELLRRFPDSALGQTTLANLELLTGSPERAAELYERLVRDASQTHLLSNLGLAYMLLGRYAEAEESFRQALALSPRSPESALNLADVHFLQGKWSEAVKLYKEVIRLVDEDPAADQAQLQATRAQALAHLGRGSEAVAAVQQALRQSPDDPQIAYAVSLVYAVVGDDTSALLNAKRALEDGVEPRWFTLPWFAPLRAAPELQAVGPWPSSPGNSSPSLRR
ncbi:MAG TPA: tetratricopeptide repeat protein, partial [Thermoanaerobaculia bacterium]|nr:tetratricopeptide repeat protein [Thermoanaerobaculia bacterium]